MSTKTFRYYTYGSVLSVIVFFSAVELFTRTVSWATGKGFTLAVHELEPYDRGVTEAYQWHPFTGITFRPNIVFEGGHPYRKERVSVMVDRHGFLANALTLSVRKANNEIRIATIGGSTTAGAGLAADENWPGKLTLLVQQSLPDKRVTMINGGGSGV